MGTLRDLHQIAEAGRRLADSGDVLPHGLDRAIRELRQLSRGVAVVAVGVGVLLLVALAAVVLAAEQNRPRGVAPQLGPWSRRVPEQERAE